MIEKMKEKFTKYEIARILGARALQLAMDAPVLLRINKERLEEINYDVLKIAELEFQEEVLPITVKRPFPKKVEEKIKKISEEESALLEEPSLKKKLREEKKEKIEEKKEEVEDREVEQKKQLEEEKIKEEGEIMELAKPEDEVEEAVEEEEEGEI